MENLLQDRFILVPLAAVFGAVFGSFATALIYRLPRDINWVTKRSACTKCGHHLGIPDLMPLFSYLFTRGHCRYCKVKFGGNYLVTEILVAMSFALSAYIFGPTIEMIIISLLAFVTIVICYIDFEHYIIPDEANIFIALLGIAYAIGTDAPLVEQLIFMPLFYFGLAMFLRWIMFVWKKKEGLGLGDVKFFAAAGTFLGIESLPAFLFLSGIAGLMIALAWRVMKKGEMFPFGPALCISLLFCVAFPESYDKLMLFVQEITN